MKSKLTFQKGKKSKYIISVFLFVKYRLVFKRMSFREAYQKIGSQVQNGTYKPDLGKQHKHVGSIHNLSLDKIREKYPKK